ncbi:hypothetical protein, partial [Pseudomonas sp.]|uniref:hypothetical protein n=1 Tax=Pseudomonas sp. TaxID=306 RepID=UPI0025F43111
PDLRDRIVELRVADEIVELLDGSHGFSDWLEGLRDWGLGMERSRTVKGREIESRRGLGKVKCAGYSSDFGGSFLNRGNEKAPEA